MKFVQSERVGRIMRLLPSKIVLLDLAPLCVRVWCAMCNHALRATSYMSQGRDHEIVRALNYHPKAILVV